jgi:hypothetical protein
MDHLAVFIRKRAQLHAQELFGVLLQVKLALLTKVCQNSGRGTALKHVRASQGLGHHHHHVPDARLQPNKPNFSGRLPAL